MIVKTGQLKMDVIYKLPSSISLVLLVQPCFLVQITRKMYLKQEERKRKEAAKRKKKMMMKIRRGVGDE